MSGQICGAILTKKHLKMSEQPSLKRDSTMAVTAQVKGVTGGFVSK